MRDSAVDTPPRAAGAGAWIWRVSVLIYLTATILRSSSLAAVLPPSAWQAVQFGSIGAGLLAGVVVTPRFRASVPGLNLFRGSLGVFLLVALGSVLVSPDKMASMMQWVITAVMIAFVAWNAQARWSVERLNVRSDVQVLAVFFSIVQAIGCLVWIVDREAAVGPYRRFVGLFSNANYAGMISALTLIILFGLAFSATSRAARVTHGILAVPVVAALALSGSRAAGIACVIGIALVLCSVVTRRSVRGLVGVLTAAVVVGIVLAPAQAIRDDFADVAPSQEPTAPGLESDDGGSSGQADAAEILEESYALINGQSSGRLELYVESMAQWAKEPLLGHGFRSAPDVIGGAETHNLLLQVLVETGLAGFAAFVGMLVGLWLRARAGGLNATLGAAVIATAILELSESSMFGWGGPSALYFWTVVFAFFYAEGWTRGTALLAHDVPGVTRA